MLTIALLLVGCAPDYAGTWAGGGGCGDGSDYEISFAMDWDGAELSDEVSAVEIKLDPATVPVSGTVELAIDVTVDQVNEVMRSAAEGPMSGVLEYSEDPLVSSDIIGNSHSSIYDSLSTATLGPRHLRVLSCYDNEWRYSNRVVDLLARLAEMD